MLIKSYITPHPPIILGPIGRGEEKKIQKTIDSLKKISQDIKNIQPETIVFISPHAPHFINGFYIGKGDNAIGSMAKFNSPSFILKQKYDTQLAEEIIKNTNIPIFYGNHDNDIDHGVFVPLNFIKEVFNNFKIVIIGVSSLSDEKHYEFGQTIRKAIDSLNRKAIVIASGDLSHTLKAHGPYGYRKEGEIFDEKIIDILSKADFNSLMNFPEYLIEKASECGMRPFQMMSGIFNGDKVKPHFYSYEKTFGVGYAVFEFERVI